MFLLTSVPGRKILRIRSERQAVTERIARQHAVARKNTIADLWPSRRGVPAVGIALGDALTVDPA